MKSQIKFAEKKLKDALIKLRNSKTEDKKLYSWINRALDDIEEDAFCSVQIPKKLIPKKYIKEYKIDNLWKYDLPNGWRLFYSIVAGDVIVISIVIEWMTHKEYERRFGY